LSKASFPEAGEALSLERRPAPGAGKTGRRSRPVAGAGLTVLDLRADYVTGMRPFAFIYRGVAS